MAGIDESLIFYPLRIAVLTVSDTRMEETDKSGALLAERLVAAGHELAGKVIVLDEVEAIRTQVRAWWMTKASTSSSRREAPVLRRAT
jgi:molybdenum cofactor biosynthesis protein B